MKSKMHFHQYKGKSHGMKVDIKRLIMRVGKVQDHLDIFHVRHLFRYG